MPPSPDARAADPAGARPGRPRIAIACQGGGSHAAFTAGVLTELLQDGTWERFDLVGLSGTSGGAVCAALTWAGLVGRNGAEGARDAIARLEGFWHDLAVSTPWDFTVNLWGQLVSRSPITADVSPYAYTPLAEPALRKLLHRHLRLEEVTQDVAARLRPALRVGAADVLRGGGRAFDGETLLLDEVIASCAVPGLFRGVKLHGTYWWDGLYAQNPPLAQLLALENRPEEIWVIRINPRESQDVPRTVDAMRDRQNQMAGNLPLEHELAMIRQMNRLRAEFPAVAERYAPVTVRQVALDEELDYPSKLDRSPSHLRRLRQRGRELALNFLRSDSIILEPLREAPSAAEVIEAGNQVLADG